MSSSYLYVNDLRIHYLHWNLAEGSKPVLLLHGLASNARIWELTAPHLAKQGLSLLAPEARGHGLSDKPDSNYDHATIRSDLLAFIDACQLEHPFLVGHSWGASIALDYAASVAFGPRAPYGIVMVDGGFVQMNDLPDATWENMQKQLEPPKLAGMLVDEFIELLETSNSTWFPPERKDEIIAIILANFEIDQDDKIYPRLTYERHMQIVRAMWEYQTYERYARVRCPVLAVPALPKEPHTSREQAFLQAKERGLSRAQETISDLRVHWMLDSIHDIPLQHPTKLASIISDFVASIS